MIASTYEKAIENQFGTSPICGVISKPSDWNYKLDVDKLDETINEYDLTSWDELEKDLDIPGLRSIALNPKAEAPYRLITKIAESINSNVGYFYNIPKVPYKSEEQLLIDNIIRDYNDGIKYVDIAKKYNISERKISKILNKHYNLVPDRRHKQIMQLKRTVKNINKNKVFELWQTGMSYVQIAKKYGCSQQYIGAIVSELKQYKQYTDPKDVIEQKILRLLKDGLTYEEIGKECNCSSEKTYHIAKKYGISRKKLLSEDTKNKIIKMYEADPTRTYKEISSMIGVSIASVGRVLRSKKQSFIDGNGVSTANEIISLYKNGATIKEISKTVDVSTDSVREVLRGVNLYTPEIRAITSEEKAKIIEMYETNPYITYDQIAEEIGFSNTAVGNVIRKYNREKEVLTEDVKQEIISLYKDGLNVTQISKMVDFSQASVSKVINFYKEGNQDMKEIKSTTSNKAEVKPMVENKVETPSTDVVKDELQNAIDILESLKDVYRYPDGSIKNVCDKLETVPKENRQLCIDLINGIIDKFIKK